MTIAESSVLDLTHEPSLYINRELSLLAFNRRVLDQARDAATPLLERLKFLCISSTTLDEFFEIRVARLQQEVASGSVQAGPHNHTPHETPKPNHKEARRLGEKKN